ncbi:LysM peptidoglycan-binding domain-containing protein [Streptomyces sp. NPDC058326]|uniref:CIS tube protein n=1 Tax=Streptomyces sp. NPDC058326 TaxID=3346447 RepID=UPI0036E6340F
MILDEQQLAKLTIEVFRDQRFTEPAGRWQAQFNPTELSFGLKNRYTNEQPAGASKPATSYAGGEPDQLSLEFFFDGTGVVDAGDTVRARLRALLDLTRFQPDSHAPYYLRLHWGDFVFPGVMLSADVTYHLFDREGEPVRARVKATFQEVVEPEDLAKAERRESADLYRTWLVREGDTIDGIAHRVYGAVEFWRPVAEANRLVNPRRLSPGTVLVLPPKAV